MSNHEYYPVQRDEYLQHGAFEAATSHWKEYFGTALPLGDESSWDTVVINAIAEIGIPRTSAFNINENAKLEARYTD